VHDRIELPDPTGPFATGRTVFHWIDHARDEPDTEDPNDRRELLVYLWYPAEPSNRGTPAPYFPELEGLKRKLGEDALKTGMGEAYDSIVRPRRTRSTSNATVVADGRRHPVLVFSHGMEEKSTFYTALLEDLASHGYVVAAIEHPYHSLGVVYPDGRTVAFNRKKWRLNRPRPRLDPGASDRFEVANQTTGARDIMFVLDQLEKLDNGDVGNPFRGRLDLARAGAFGHSFGGFVAARAGELDNRLKGCLNVDGTNNGRPFLTDAPAGGPTQPFMYVGSKFTGRKDRRDGPDPESLQFTESLFRSIRAPSYRVVIEGFEHEDCADGPILAAMPGSPAMTARLRRMQVVRAYVNGFFDKHVLGKPTPLLDGPSADYPEVRFHRFNPSRP
jgi:hypothetical protein